MWLLLSCQVEAVVLPEGLIGLGNREKIRFQSPSHSPSPGTSPHATQLVLPRVNDLQENKREYQKNKDVIFYNLI